MSDSLPTFEHALEADMQKLAAEIRTQRERPEMKNAAEKEIVKEAIRAFPQLPKHPESANGNATPSVSAGPLPGYVDDAPPETKLEIEYLLDTALRHGLEKAVTESKKSPYFVQDAFHDALAGKLYPELQKRGIVK